MKRVVKLLKFICLSIPFLSSTVLPLLSCSRQIYITIDGPTQIYSIDQPTYKANVISNSNNEEVIWDTSNHSIASINRLTGKLEPFSSGEISIYAILASDHSIVSSLRISILDAPNEVQIIGDETAAINCPQQYTAKILPPSAEQSVSWSVLNVDGEATINDSGVLQPIKLGGVMIYAKSTNPNIDSGFLYVKILNVPTSIEISNCPEQMAVGAPPFICTVTDSKDCKNNVYWTSSNDNVAKIDRITGQLEALSPGQAKIRATSTINPDIYDEKEITITGEIPTVLDFVTDSWKTVIFYANQGIEALSNAYYDTPSYIANNYSFVGLTRKIIIGQDEYTVRVIGANADTISGTQKKAALTFEFVQAISNSNWSAIQYPWNNDSPENVWYSHTSEADIRSFLQTYIFKEINQGLGFFGEETPIKRVNKITCYHDDDPITSQDTIFLPSLIECLGTNIINNSKHFIIDQDRERYKNEGIQYEWYTRNINPDSDPSRESIEALEKKDLSGNTVQWWYRSGFFDIEVIYWFSGQGQEQMWKDPTSQPKAFFPCFCI